MTYEDIKAKAAADMADFTRKDVLLDSIAIWLRRVDFPTFLRALENAVLGQDELSTIAVVVYSYLKNAVSGEAPAGGLNSIIAAPSGCGKTETYRALKRYFRKYIPGLPVLITDMTKATTEGFRGANTADLFSELITAGTDGIGLMFLDELDKRFEPQYTFGGENVGQTVQNQLLTVIEGTLLHGKGCAPIDTSHTLFIGLGSFAYARDIRQKKAEAQSRTIGFGTVRDSHDPHYLAVTKEDMAEAGGSYEMLGRFPVVVNYYSLKREVLDEVIDRFAEDISSTLACPVELTTAYRTELYDIAAGRYGLRSVYNRMLGDALPCCKLILLGEADTILLGGVGENECTPALV